MPVLVDAYCNSLVWWLSQLPDSPPQADVGLPFDVPATGPYLTWSYQPNRPPPGAIGYTESRAEQGIFQVSVLWPENQGVVPAYTLASTIADHFKPSANPIAFQGVGGVRVQDHPTVGGHLKQKDGRVMVPVTVSWIVW